MNSNEEARRIAGINKESVGDVTFSQVEELLNDLDYIVGTSDAADFEKDEALVAAKEDFETNNPYSKTATGKFNLLKRGWNINGPIYQKDFPQGSLDSLYQDLINFAEEFDISVNFLLDEIASEDGVSLEATLISSHRNPAHANDLKTEIGIMQEEMTTGDMAIADASHVGFIKKNKEEIDKDILKILQDTDFEELEKEGDDLNKK